MHVQKRVWQWFFVPCRQYIFLPLPVQGQSGQSFFTLSLSLFSSLPRGGALTCHSQVHTGEGAAKGMCRERSGGATLLPSQSQRKKGRVLPAAHLNSLSKRGGTRHTCSLKHKSYPGGIFSWFYTAPRGVGRELFPGSTRSSPVVWICEDAGGKQVIFPLRLIIGHKGEN